MVPPGNLQSESICLWTVGRNWRKQTQIYGEHANSTDKGLESHRESNLGHFCCDVTL